MSDYSIPENLASKAAREWLECRDIIARTLKDIDPNQTKDRMEHNASAIIARLAAADYLLVKASDFPD